MSDPARHVVHTLGSLSAAHGGPSRSVTRLAEALVAEGTTVDVVAMREPSGGRVVPDDARVRVHLAPGSERDAAWRAAASPFGRTVASVLRPGSVVHDHGLWLPVNRTASVVAQRAGAPLVVSPKGMVAAEALAAGGAKKRLAWHLYQRRALRRAAAFSVTSPGEVTDVRRLGMRQPIALVPHGVAVPPDMPKHAPALLGGVRTALFLSRIHPQKGIDELLAAWAAVRPAGWRLQIVGPGEAGHLASVRRQIRERGLEADVTLHGAVDGVAKWALYTAADLFVLPSRSENFGAAIAEALAAGTPVLTTRGTPWEALVSHRCGWWVGATPDAIGAALAEATALPPEERAAMGARGRAYVRATLTWEASARAHAALYAWLQGRGERPACVVAE